MLTARNALKLKWNVIITTNIGCIVLVYEHKEATNRSIVPDFELA